MKVVFFQQKRERYYSVHILFDIIRQKLPASVQIKTLSYQLSGNSPLKKLSQLIKVSRQEISDVNHIVEEINYAALFMPKRKTILTIHDVMRLYKTSGLKKQFFIWFWLKMPMAKSAIVTAVSKTSRDEILKYVNWPEEKIRIVYNCIAPGFIPSPKTFNKEKPVILQVGIKPSKNLPRMIEAISGISCKLNIVGKPSAEAEQLLKQYNIDYSYQQNLTQEQVIQQYIDCDMVVFASLYEGFGVPIIEANSIERPVVTSNVSAMAEVAGDAACLVDPLSVESIRAGVLKVINDDVYRQQLIDNGRTNKKRFDAETIAGEYYKLYEEVYNKNNK